MTKTEIEALTRSSTSKVTWCPENLLSHKSIVLMGQRDGESVYGIMEE